MSAVACTAVEYLAGAGVDVHPIICKLVAFTGGIGALVSTAAGVFAPVFLMPKPTGPYRTGKTTRLWIDGTRRSWLLRSKGRSLGKIPESRMLMANVWYPAAAPKPRLRRDAAVKKKKEASADDGYESGSDGGCDSGDDLGKHWPDDEAAKVHYEAMAQEKLIMAQALGSPDGKRIGDRTGAGPGVSNRITIANARKAEARRRRRRQRGKRTHWLEPTLATTMAVSFGEFILILVLAIRMTSCFVTFGWCGWRRGWTCRWRTRPRRHRASTAPRKASRSCCSRTRSPA